MSDDVSVLEPHLAQRVEPGATRPREEGAFIIYWMRVAVRATENPALDVALAIGAALKKPVFVYQALSENYRYASDRLHTFILEGARDVQAALRERGVGTVFHLERGGHREPVLTHLAKQAALVVTDFMPVEPLLRWDAAVASVAPLWRVDASCLAPLWRFSTAVTRADEFRALATPVWNEQLTAPYRDFESSALAFVPDVPFEPLELEHADLPALVAACDIDHSVGPVHHSRGGTASGMQRWDRFLEHHLDDYARARKDPTLAGTSRMSAFLHFGHVSPFKLARDVHERKSPGTEAFLKELLTWRELAWHFCWHNPGHERVEVLPPWARATLQQHEQDARPMLPSWETLARAQTGDILWDSCQRLLLTHGELHNAARMTWGKALLSWTRSARDAMALLIDLNHRYALDGRDPSSYGGILWCLGQFDRPFTPEVPILGQVRPRPLEEYSKRINLAAFNRHSRRAARGQPLTVAVVGAGIAGAAAARTLVDAGQVVTLFDEGLAPAGRLLSQKLPWRFDVGAPYFTVSDERFARCARAWWQERVIAQWKPREAVATSPHEAPPVKLVAMPGMSALLARVLLDLDVRFDTQVDQLVREDGRWRLTSRLGEKLGEYDGLVLAVPAPVAARLIDPTSFPVATRLRTVEFSACQTLLVTFDESLGLEWDLVTSSVGPLMRLIRDSSKPERAPGERWVAYASPTWSERHADDAPDKVAAALLDALFATTGARRIEPRFLAAHFWKHALTTRPLGEDCQFDAKRRLAACGDWCRGGGIEAAWLSGVAAAGRLNALEGAPVEDVQPMTRRPSQMRLI